MQSNLFEFTDMAESRNRKFKAGDLTAQVAANLRACQLHAQKTQDEIAFASGVQQRTVGRYLAGDQAMNIEILASLATGFELEPWQLLAPGFDPANPQIIRGRTKAEADFEQKLKEAFAALKPTQ